MPICIAAPSAYVCNTVLAAKGQVRRVFQATAISAALKVGVLCAAAGITHRISTLAAIATVAGFVEAGVFMWQVSRVGDAGWRRAAGGFVRSVTSGGIMAAVLYQTGLGWTEVHITGVAALLQGSAIGGGLLVYAAVQFGLWRMAGRPDGPETRLIGIARRFLTRLAVRLRAGLLRSTA